MTAEKDKEKYLENIKDNLSYFGNIKDEELLNKLLNDRKFFIETFLFVKTKNQKLVPFILNPIQNDFYYNKSNYNIVLKARQVGFSTLILALNFVDTILTPYTTTVVVAHKADSAMQLFETIKIFYEYLPDIIKPPIKYSNRKELYFKDSNNPSNSLESRIYIATAGSNSMGKGGNRGITINNLHLSEYAFYPSFELDDLFEAVPMLEGHSKIFIESTPNGLNNFYDLYMASKEGKTIYKAFFYPWYKHPEYSISFKDETEKDSFSKSLTNEEQNLIKQYKLTLEQIKWFRVKVSVPDGLKKFKENYPFDDISCFMSSVVSEFSDINLTNLLKYSQNTKPIPNIFANPKIKVYKLPEHNKNYIMGIDVSETGKSSDSAIEILYYDSSLDKYVQVLEYVDKIDINSLTDISILLGKFYNNCLIIPERNNDGKVLINNLLISGYRNIYVEGDTEGFLTTEYSKSTIINLLRKLLLQEKIIIYSQDLLEEIRTYNRNKKQSGKQKHYDSLMAFMIGLYGLVYSYYTPVEDRGLLDKEEDKLIDYIDIDKDLDGFDLE